MDDIISERINSYELSKMKTNGVLVFFEDQNIEYFQKCDQVLNCHCLVGPKTVAHLTGRTKDDKLPFHIRPVLHELLRRDVAVFVMRDRDGLSNDITDTIINVADECEINYHFLNNYEVESYLLSPSLFHRALKARNPDTEIPTEDELAQKVFDVLLDTIRLAKYKYSTVLEDCLCKLSSFDGLELYCSSNEYRKKAEQIRATNETCTDIDSLRRVGMGKECLKEIMRWLNEDLHLRISKKELLNQLNEDDIPNEIKEFFESIKSAME